MPKHCEPEKEIYRTAFTQPHTLVSYGQDHAEGGSRSFLPDLFVAYDPPVCRITAIMTSPTA